MTQLLLTAVGVDRAGLVSDLSEIVASYDGNWLDSRMARLAGAFAGIVLVDIDNSKVEPLKADLNRLEAKGLRVTVTDTSPHHDEGEAVLVVHLVGHDHQGIIHNVTSTMARLGVTIDDLSTGLREAPMGDGILFEAQVQCRITNSTTLDELRSELEAIATEIMVDIDLVDRS
ncbi:amino acid-binding protein [Cutibacterium sp. WCA-380-WT-3A]|uniref:Amino acid-binding protein n=1 Tax=Cutibacterium porci TaxID=2605781 RepID=A0A7K0J9Q1_9ACTN|nr:ACT domain-containing protein [Cutibacterium porci]MSS46701.1 amino acid-binding protein [Cutibacterium porci]